MRVRLLLPGRACCTPTLCQQQNVENCTLALGKPPKRTSEFRETLHETDLQRQLSLLMYALWVKARQEHPQIMEDCIFDLCRQVAERHLRVLADT